MKIAAIVQARMSSSRLPGKVLLDLGGQPMLQWVFERTCRASLLDEVVVATTIDPSDDPIFDFCQQNGYPVDRGSVYNVLDRYYQTAKKRQADIVVRITADCPLIDPALIDKAVKLLLPDMDSRYPHDEINAPRFDFVANRLPPPWGRTYPIGLDIEVFTYELLKQGWMTADSKHQREHVTPYFYEGTPAEQLKYKIPNSPFSSGMTPNGHTIALMHHTPDLGYLRWTVDTPEDLALLRAIVINFPDNSFGWKSALDFIDRNPELGNINAHVKHKTQFDVDRRA